MIFGFAKGRLWGLSFVALLLFAAIVLIDQLFPPSLNDVRYGSIVVDRNNTPFHYSPLVLSAGDVRWRFKTSLQNVDPDFIRHVLAIEDRRFYQHRGVDPIALIRASLSSIRARRVVSGASTITMQTARLLEPRPRNVRSKLIEMLRALQIERRLSKQEILELYFSLAPYGSNIEGLEAASLTWLGKPPHALTLAEQALLIALPQAPESRRPDRNPVLAQQARDAIVHRLLANGLISPRAATEVSQQSVPTGRNRLMRSGWHVARQAIQSQESPALITTSIDAGLQQRLEAYSAKQAEMRQRNIALLVVDHRSMQVRALVGSANLKTNGGWIDMTTASRSPGSTLKPFIYGIAFEHGLASAETSLTDKSYSFAGYSPENFNQRFFGDVTIAQALQHSLNVPAVLLLDKIGGQHFVAQLKAAGLDPDIPGHASNENHLPVALGGLGINMRELATLYAALANEGLVRPISFQRDAVKTQNAARLFSPHTSRALSDVLEQSPGVAGRAPAGLTKSAPRIAFKTGTSYGFRDAWACGNDARHTVIAWSGHANGAPVPSATGRNTALPIMMDVFDFMRDDPDTRRRPPQPLRKPAFKTGKMLASLEVQSTEQALQMAFPQPGVELDISEGAAQQSWSFSATGGSPPYRWFVDGLPTEAPTRWSPAHAGFFDVSVVDAVGDTTSSRVHVVRQEKRDQLSAYPNTLAR